MTNPSASARLRAAGLRVTKPRLAVLQVLDDAGHGHEHLTVAAVLDRARPSLGRVSTQTVYDCLAAMTRAGLLRAVEPAGHPVRYEARVENAHHHLVCRECGHIADVAGVLGEDPCLTQPAGGYRVDTTEVTFWGRCADCARPDQLHNREVRR